MDQVAMIRRQAKNEENSIRGVTRDSWKITIRSMYASGAIISSL